MVLGPRRVHHNGLSAPTRKSVENREESVVVELRPAQEGILGDIVLIVVRQRAVRDATQHVCADGGVVGVGRDFSTTDVLENGIRERIAWKEDDFKRH